MSNLWSFCWNWSRAVLKGHFPGGLVIKNLPCNAGDMGSIPGGGTKIPHAMGNEAWAQKLLSHILWSPWATARESVCYKERSHMTKWRSHMPQLRLDTDRQINFLKKGQFWRKWQEKKTPQTLGFYGVQDMHGLEEGHQPPCLLLS